VNRYVQSAQLDGKPLTKPWFYHSIWLMVFAYLTNGPKTQYAMGQQTGRCAAIYVGEQREEVIQGEGFKA